ncbi:acyltransferase family protein [Bacteroides cellulosilyticus]|jgi:fucose 4-O-acetylase-like acetyltransferase|uniref:Acyltransferase 3 domain-containing protein n=1 Tax=Bacteroides cellulosilyticus TaxID=246787 RepID=A0A412IH56_9BACE|nr:hypothetical protein DWX97_11965 [Bacteroides cellulosilyticus]
MKYRIGYFDSAKGFAIFSVVLAHLNTFLDWKNLLLSYVVHSYFMSLFFFISGYFCYREVPFLQFSFLKGKIKQLVIPYLTTCLLVCFFYSLLFQTNLLDRYLLDSSKGGYWFLLTLFTYYCFYLCVNRIAQLFKKEIQKKSIFVILIILLGVGIVFVTSSVSVQISYLLSLPELRRFFLSFSFGLIVSCFASHFNVWNNKITILSGILYFSIMLMNYDDKTCIGFVLWLTVSNLACLFIINIFRLLGDNVSRLRTYGNNSLGIYLYHYIFVYFLKYFLPSSWFYGTSTWDIILIFLFFFILSIIVLELSLLLIRLTNKLKLNFLIGS